MRVQIVERPGGAHSLLAFPVPNQRRNIGESDPRPTIHRDHLLDCVLQFADIPRPVVLLERLHDFIGNPVTVAIAFEEVFDKGGNIVPTFA